MPIKTILVSLALMLFAGCNGGGASNGATSASGQVTVGQAIVSWRPFLQTDAQPGLTNVMVLFRGVNERVDDITNPADGCFPAMRNYEECRRANRELRLSKAESIRLATQAFASHPTCSWAGYDPAYDARARGRGLASSSDTRVLFAQVRC